ncbi:MAG TPA: Gfo/Idh/MocA family oxidoreductase, partial [Symbiobacteriaceae bacterium]|nr:Gfo/Idh/MocA family oxidoreductase [Symbiobacteriaceae bacterium]
ERNEVVAIASRELATAEAARAKLGLARAYGSYAELVADPEIDAVYIPLPNHLHAEWTIAAAQAGKHVLCEKPLAMDAAEAIRMVNACREAGVHMAEAFMYRHHPRYKRVREIIASGEIGDVRVIRGAFTFNNGAAAENVRFHRDMGGGGLYDVGCYPISAARYILGCEPEAITAQAFFSPRHDNVDMMLSGLLEFPGNVALTFDCGMWAYARNTLEILGTLGMIELPSAFIWRGPDVNALHVTVGGEKRVEPAADLDHYTLMADEFAKVVLDGRPPRFPAEDAIAQMRILEAGLKSARERVRVVL